jgi:undecaprenyl-diphosphatase
MATSDRDSVPAEVWRTGRRRVGRALAVALPWLHRHVRGLYAAVGLYLLVGLALAALALWGFTGLAEAVSEGETTGFDRAVLLWIDQHATPELTVMALEVTALANTLVVAVVVLVAAAFLWFTRHSDAVFLLGAAVAGSGLLLQILKSAFERPQPELIPWRAAYAGGFAFPSGHAMSATVVYTTLAYPIIRLDPHPAVRHFTAITAAAIILLVGLSRVYLAVHYPTDVLAGFAVGFAWAIFAAFGLEVFRYLRDMGAVETRSKGSRAA